MPLFVTESAAGGRLLTRHLHRLCQSLEALAGRVRAAVAETLSNCVSGAVREAVEAALSGSPEPPGRAPSPYPAPTSALRSSTWWHDPDRPEWEDGDPYDEPQEEYGAPGPGARAEGTPLPSPRWRSALAAGLQAAAFWLRRWPAARLPWPWAIGLGVVAGAAVYLGGPPVALGVGLAGSALGLAALAPE
jgi:hypothetical protein